MIDTSKYEIYIGADGVALIKWSKTYYQEYLCNPEEAYILIAHTECEGDGA